jgi:hypothetical protein
LIAQTPPAGVLFSVVVEPTHVAIEPVIGVGSGFTVTVAIRIQPVPSVYVIVTVLAGAAGDDIPFTTPLLDPIVAIPVAPLVHTPPAGAPFSVVVLFTHTEAVPVIVPGNANTVTTVVTRQPVLNVYDTAAVPAILPSTSPVDPVTVTFGDGLDHVPPAVMLFSVVVCPTHIVPVPVIAAGSGLIVATVVSEQVVGSVYVSVVVPASTPPSIPEVLPIVPLAGVLLSHVPPAGVPVSVDDDPSHTCSEPVTPVGRPFTSTTIVRKQPVDNVYVIVAVPAIAPVTTPVAGTTVALALLLVHVPPAGVLLSVVVAFTHMVVPPVMIPGSAFAVTVVVRWQPVVAV